MPDITMCNDESCPMRMECYRYRAIPSKMLQSYFIDSPREGETCDYFISIEECRTVRPETSGQSPVSACSLDGTQQNLPASFPSDS